MVKAQAQDEDEDGFTYVRTSRRRGGGGGGAQRNGKDISKSSSSASSSQVNAQKILAGHGDQDADVATSVEDQEVIVQRVCARIDGFRSTLQKSDGLMRTVQDAVQEYAKCRGASGSTVGADVSNAATIPPSSPSFARPQALAQTIYALGMGCISTSRSAQIQLALLLELRRECTSAPQSACEPPEVYAYDPVSAKSSTDGAILSAYAIKHVDTTTDAEAISPRAYTHPVLLYMPHCPRPLHEIYISATFTAAGLRNVLLCSNRLGRYAEFLSEHVMYREMPAVWRIAPYLRSLAVPVPAATECEGALSGLALQWFDARQQKEESVSVTTRGRGRRRAPAPASAHPRPTPDQDAFWILPPREIGLADQEVL